MKSNQLVYPFAAIVGQEEMKQALLLNAVNPAVGGVLIRGEKGTAKSTAVRGLAEILPERKIVRGCTCGCQLESSNGLCPDCMERLASGDVNEETVPMRVVELPLSSTEDRVVGTLDIEYAISTGKKKFEPGVLAKANGNILYVDEINLLDDHIVDLLLDAAAMGRNYVEREGVSYEHPSKFTLIGTMNPEEGDLRPQLLDRFGLMTEVRGEYDELRRKEIVRRRVAFEKDPESFSEEYSQETDGLRKRISEAKSLVKNVEPIDEALDMAVKISLHLGVDGHRADLTMIKAACSRAALDGRMVAEPEDVVAVSKLVLPHRMRRNPFQESRIETKDFDKWMKEELAHLKQRCRYPPWSAPTWRKMP